MLRAQAELANFRTRVERDRAANREAVIAEVIRSLLPALDDLDRARAHGDLVEGTPLAIVAQKLRAGFEKYGLRTVGAKGEPFDPALHEAIFQVPTPDVTVNTIADVVEIGYVLGDASCGRPRSSSPCPPSRHREEAPMASQDWFDKDFYDVLGVSKNVTDADLKKTYRKLARQYHPDSNPGDAKARRRSSRRSARRTRCSPTPSSARSTTRSARWARAPASPRAGARAPGGSRTSSAACSAGSAVASGTSTGGGQSGSFDDLLGGMFGGGGGFGTSSGRLPRLRRADAGPDVTARTTLDFVTATKGETITLQPAGRQADQGQDPGGRRRRAEDPAQGQGRAVPGRRRARRPRAHGEPCASIRCSSATGSTCASTVPA